MLGATAELLDLAPDVLAVDHNRAMLDRLELPPDRTVLHDWRVLPATIGLFDFIVGDGSLSGLRFPDDYAMVRDRVKSLLRSGAKMVLRLYCAPPDGDPLAAVVADAMAGRIANFHAFKLRLAMAVAAQDATATIEVAEIFTCFETMLPDRNALARASGWSLAQIGVIDAYRASRISYSFPTLAQVCDRLAPAFHMLACDHGHYDLAERCPVRDVHGPVIRDPAAIWEGMRSDVGGVAWPPLASGGVAAVLALSQQLQAIERLAPDAIAAGQYRQLVAWATYAAAHSPYVAESLQAAGLAPTDLVGPAQLRKLPILSRRTLLTRKATIDCRAVPAGHAPCSETGTSGSTGKPVYVTRTPITSRFWLAHTMRDHIWHDRDFAGTLAVMRGSLAPGTASDQTDWGVPASLFFRTGRLHLLPIALDVAEQARRLASIDPAYLLTSPGTLAALLDRFARHGGLPTNLKQIRTTGETVSPALRARCPLPITDLYSSQEAGIIAIQCPGGEGYHVMAESLIVEVVDAAGAPCGPGEIGRVLITDLTNFATPLLRYDIGDVAEAGTICACGRGLPTLRRIVGRSGSSPLSIVSPPIPRASGRISFQTPAKADRAALLTTTSRVASLVWPPLADAASGPLQALLAQLDTTQYWSPEKLEAAQFRQLTALLDHAAPLSPYVEALVSAHGRPGDRQTLLALPLLSRRTLQSDLEAIRCRELPHSHLPVAPVQSSGATGEPVRIFRTGITQRFWQAYTMREHLWHDRDWSGTLAAIRATWDWAVPVAAPDWGEPASLLFETGPAHAMRIDRDSAAQAAWLAGIDPDYLLVYPGTLAGLLDVLAAGSLRLPRLKQIRTIGETLPDALRLRVRAQLGVSICDTYSSQELGCIAIQCPASGLYHVMAESLILEVLDEAAAPCAVGAIGRVVVTDLHNAATPLIRYDTGDYAEQGPPCPCGRGLPTLRRILGRARNRLHVGAERRWPLLGFHLYRDIAPIVQYQLVQTGLETIEVRLVAEKPVTTRQEDALAQVICTALGARFQLTFTYFDNSIPVGPSGKFEDFICAL